MEISNKTNCPFSTLLFLTSKFNVKAFAGTENTNKNNTNADTITPINFKDLLILQFIYKNTLFKYFV
jgi:hypothetical protein